MDVQWGGGGGGVDVAGERRFNIGGFRDDMFRAARVYGVEGEFSRPLLGRGCGLVSCEDMSVRM